MAVSKARDAPDDTGPPCVGKRHVLLLLASLGFALTHAQRHAFPTTLIAMVNNSVVSAVRGPRYRPSPSPSANDSDCPLPDNLTAFDFPQAPNAGIFTWSPMMQGFILSAYHWGGLLPLIAVGTWAQRVGGKWFFLAGVLLRTACSIATPVLAEMSPHYIVGTRAVAGLGDASTHAALAAMLGRWGPREEVAMMTAAQFVGPEFGAFLARLVTGFVINSETLGGWPEVFYVFGGVTVVWVPLWIAFVANSPSGHSSILAAERWMIEDSLGPTRQSTANKRRGGVPWVKILKDRAVWVYGLSLFGGTFVSLSYSGSLPLFLSDVLHFDIRRNSLLTGLPHLTQVIVVLLMAKIADAIVRRWPRSRTWVRRVVTAVSFVGPAACLFCVDLIGCRPWPVVGMVVLTSALASLSAAGLHCLPLDLSPEFSGTIFGLGATLAGLAEIISNLLIDAITHHGTRMEWRIVFYSAAVVGIAAGLLFVLAASAERRWWASHEILADDEVYPDEAQEPRERKDTLRMTAAVRNVKLNSNVSASGSSSSRGSLSKKRRSRKR